MLPTSYQEGSEKHPIIQPLIKFDRTCKSCTLSCSEATFGAGPDDLSQVRLIVISDFSGAYEQENNMPFWPNDEKRKPKRIKKTGRYSVEGFRNAGSMLRYTLNRMFGLDTYSDCWMTNVIKCNPKDTKPTEKHAKICTDKWLKNELAILDRYVPDVPVLIAGGIAFKGLKYAFPELGNALPKGLSDYRRTNHTRLGEHPLVFTTNPAPVARSEFRVETTIGLDEDQIYRIDEVHTIEPIVGSPPWHFERDLEFLRPFLK
jgi:hypothetical protein